MIRLARNSVIFSKNNKGTTSRLSGNLTTVMADSEGVCQSVIDNYIVKFANLERGIQLASCLKQQLQSGISVQSLFWGFNCIGVLVTCVEAFFLKYRLLLVLFISQQLSSTHAYCGNFHGVRFPLGRQLPVFQT